MPADTVVVSVVSSSAHSRRIEGHGEIVVVVVRGAKVGVGFRLFVGVEGLCNGPLSVTMLAVMEMAIASDVLEEVHILVVVVR